MVTMRERPAVQVNGGATVQGCERTLLEQYAAQLRRELAQIESQLRGETGPDSITR